MEKIGLHRVDNKSIENLNLRPMLNGKKVRIFYTDPPWGEGHMKYFNTINQKETGRKSKPLLFIQLLEELKHMIKTYVDGYVFVEFGVKQLEDIKSKIAPGLYNIKIFDVFYKGGGKFLPCKILVAGTKPQYKFKENLNGIKCQGYNLPQRCISEVGKKGEMVLDPLCGLGNVAKATIQEDMVFIGNEFNRKRLARTKEILQ